MADNKTQPTTVSIDTFLEKVSDVRRDEARMLIAVMEEVSGEKPVMWGPSIIGFGTQHYKYDTGREGDMPRLSFSPRKAAITVYFSEGFGQYADELAKLGKYKQSASCLYINKLSEIDSKILRTMIDRSYALAAAPQGSPANVEDYIARVPLSARPVFDELRSLVKNTLPNAQEVLSYGVIGYKIDDKRPRVFISGWKDHLGVYPIPNDDTLRVELEPYIKGKGTLWFTLHAPLPKQLLQRTIRALAS